MKSKLLLPLVGLFAAASLFGTTYSAWASDGTVDMSHVVQVETPAWGFDTLPDFAQFQNVSTCSFVTASSETTITSPRSPGPEAVRLTNTAGTQNKSHTVNISTDRVYTVGEIEVMKVEVDYYHIEKRQQQGKGFPKVRLLYNDSGKGNTQGGGESVNDKSVFLATNINSDWWHLEYFITALTPTRADHGDSPISASQKINGIQIIDDAIYDFNTNPAFVVIDNLRFGSSPSNRLGLFNRTSGVSIGGYFWFKVAWSGELHSVNITFSDDTVLAYAPSAKSPFYVKGLKAGTVVATATLEVGDDHQFLSISNTLKVS